MALEKGVRFSWGQGAGSWGLEEAVSREP